MNTMMRIIDDNRPTREADGVVGQYSFWLGDEGDPDIDADMDDDTEATGEGTGPMRDGDRRTAGEGESA